MDIFRAPPWQPISRLVLLLIAPLALAGAVRPAAAACDRTYSVGVSESSTFSHTERGELKGLVPVVLAELTRRTGCTFEIRNMPRARLWALWKTGTLDLVTGAVQTAERDQEGSFTAFGYAQEVLISYIAPPGQSLEGWLDMPQHPVLGRLRSAVSGGSVDELLARPRYAAQIEEGVDHASVIRKLFAKRSAGVLLARPAFDHLVAEMGFDPAGLTSHVVEEVPRVAYGIYFRTPQVSNNDQRSMISVLEALMKSGFDEAAYAAIVGKAVSAQLYRER